MHHHNAPLNQLADPSRLGSDPLLEAVSGSLPPRLQLNAGPARGAVVAQGHQPAPRAHVHLDFKTVEARPTGLTNSGPAVSSRRCSYRRPVSLADSVA